MQRKKQRPESSAESSEITSAVPVPGRGYYRAMFQSMCFWHFHFYLKGKDKTLDSTNLKRYPLYPKGKT